MIHYVLHSTYSEYRNTTQMRHRANSINDNNNNKMVTINHCLIAIVY